MRRTVRRALIAIGVCMLCYLMLARLTGLPPFHAGVGRGVTFARAWMLPDHPEHLPIAWYFGPPYSIFEYYRGNGQTWVRGFEIRAKNRTGEFLDGLRADIHADRNSRDFKLDLGIAGLVVDLSKSPGFAIAPDEEMRLVAPLPSVRDRGPEGIPADELVNYLGGLTFTFRARGAATFSKYFPVAEIEQQVSFIKEQSWKPD